MADSFSLDPVLAGDTLLVADLKLCRFLLMDEPGWPWAILVPRRAGAVEIVDLAPADRAALMDEIAEVSSLLRRLHQPKKLNVAALGNQVAQLHVHIIARHATDIAWPNPVWGSKARDRYAPADLAARAAQWRAALRP
jgi:diadenosine tetraphosphate (Ap4A) HIT family hydrolase